MQTSSISAVSVKMTKGPNYLKVKKKYVTRLNGRAYFFRTKFILEILDKWQVLLMDQNFFPQLPVYIL